MGTEIRPGRMRMSFDMPTEIYKDIKALAFIDGTTNITIAISALAEYINERTDELKPYRERRK